MDSEVRKRLEALIVAGVRDTGHGFVSSDCVKLTMKEAAGLSAALDAATSALKDERARGWRDAVYCVQYYLANWQQDIRDPVRSEALRDAAQGLVDELVLAEPSEWLNTEWKSAQDWMTEIDAATARAKEAERKCADLSETWTDDHDVCWRPPTAHAYAMACKALHAKDAKLAEAREVIAPFAAAGKVIRDGAPASAELRRAASFLSAEGE